MKKNSHEGETSVKAQKNGRSPFTKTPRKYSEDAERMKKIMNERRYDEIKLIRKSRNG